MTLACNQYHILCDSYIYIYIYTHLKDFINICTCMCNFEFFFFLFEKRFTLRLEMSL